MKIRIICWLLALVVVSTYLPIGVALAAIPTAQASSHPLVTLTLADRLGGPALAVAVQDHYAFVGHSFELAVLNITDRAHPQRVAYLPISASELLVTGPRLYVIGRGGLHVIDITQPVQPKQIGFLATPVTLTGLAVEDDKVYVIDFRGGFYVVESSSPPTLQIIGQSTLDRRLEGLAVSRGYAYVTTYGQLFILDVRHPARPVSIDVLPFWGWLQGILIVKQRAYVTGESGLSILDVTNPDHPILCGQIKLGGFTNHVAVTGDYAYVSNGVAGVQAINVADPTAPMVSDSVVLPGIALGIAAQGSAIYVANLGGNLSILSAQPLTLTSVYHTPGTVRRTAPVGHFLYTLESLTGQLQILDTTEPARLVWTASFPTENAVQHIVAHGNTAYLVDDTGGLYILDIRHPGQPTQVAFLHLPGKVAALAITVSGFLLASSKDSWIEVDVTQPTAPAIIATCPAAIKVGALATSSDSTYFTSDASIYAFDPITQCDRQHHAWFALNGAISQMLIASDYAYLAVHHQGLAIVDLANHTAPAVVSITPLAEDVADLAVAGGYMFVAAGDAGVYVFDIRKPAQPVEVAFYQTPDSAQSVTVVGKMAYVGDRFGGMLALEWLVTP